MTDDVLHASGRSLADGPDGVVSDRSDSDRVARDLATVDWAATPLGPQDTWPQSLRSAVSIMLASRFAMWMCWGPELTFLCNDAYRRDTLGRKYPWALGQPTREVWAEIWPDIAPRISQVIDHGDATWDEALMLFLERSGYPEETYHTFSYSPLRDDDGQIAGLLCVVAEETERVIAARRMGLLRDLGTALAGVRTEDQLHAAVGAVLGADQRSLPFTLTYLYDDSGVARLASCTGIDRSHRILVDPVDETVFPELAKLRSGESVLLDVTPSWPELPTGAWDTPPTQVYLVPLTQQGVEEPVGFLSCALNPHRAFDAEYAGFVELVAAQVSSGLASARAYEVERARAQALEELDAAKTAFFTNVSHEFRTPLTLLLGPAHDALSDTVEPLPGAQRERVELITRNAERLLKLVNTLLDFSRLQSGRAEARFEPTDLADYTADLASMFRPAFDKAGLSLTVEASDGVSTVWVDREMWAKIVLNLLSNALKFTFAGGVTVRLEDVVEHPSGKGARGVRLSVTDTGVGIDSAAQATLFQRFSRVQGAQSRSIEGSGIGLALVAELAAMHGGTAGVQSTPGEGSTFSVTIPVGREHLPADQVVDGAGGLPASASRAGIAEGSAPTVAASFAEVVERHARGFLAEAERWRLGDDPLDHTELGARRGTRPRVLVVDDNDDMRDYVRRLLADDYEVLSAVDGQDGLEVARAQRPDLVLTDVMMPRLDGFGLLRELHGDPTTQHIPVVMLSARAGDEAVVEGLEAGADDYLPKPFSARELRARVRANLELDRIRRTGAAVEHSRVLLDQAQRLAGVGSWEINIPANAVLGSPEFLRQVGVTADELATLGIRAVMDDLIHPDDRARVDEALRQTIESGVPYDVEVRLRAADSGYRLYRSRGEVERDASGAVVRMLGSQQDVTEQRAAQVALAEAAATAEAATREHRVADELQRHLLPEIAFAPELLEVSTFYRAGVAGTQVGGDWYDVIELGAGRTALVLGDVMGRGVRAAAVMGQLRAAVRAYARLDLPPADVLEFLDGVVRDLGEDQIVTCVYAVYDPADRSLSYANAGHLPPLVVSSDGIDTLGASGPPLGSGPLTLVEERVVLPGEATLVLYTDGLVERRDRDIDRGVEMLAASLLHQTLPVPDLPDYLVRELLPDGPDDDVAVLVARVPENESRVLAVSRTFEASTSEVAVARDFVSELLVSWAVGDSLRDEVVLLVSELVTNAVIHGRGPVEVRLRRSPVHLVLEVHDGATFLPRRLRPDPEDEHGRGLQLVALLASRWGTRPTPDGKVVWATFSLTP